MAQAYTSPDWSSGEGISASNLQSISNVLEGIVQGTDKAIHNIQINGSILLVTYVDGTTETFGISGTKGIVEVTKTSSGNVDTYTMIFTDGTTYSFTVTNGGGGGSSVIANPTLVGGEADLTALEVDGTKYKVSGGGGNADKVELTKAEYDALPDTKLTDGKMYFITDWNEGGSGMHYVLGEVKTDNVWIDGKPIYRNIIRMTVQTNLGVNTWTKTEVDAPNIDSFIDGKMLTNNKTIQTFQGWGIVDGKIALNSARAVSILADFHMLIEYTKG